MSMSMKYILRFAYKKYNLSRIRFYVVSTGEDGDVLEAFIP